MPHSHNKIVKLVASETRECINELLDADEFMKPKIILENIERRNLQVPLLKICITICILSELNDSILLSVCSREAP